MRQLYLCAAQYASEYRGALPTVTPFKWAYPPTGDIWWFGGYSQDNFVAADHFWYTWLQEGTNGASPYVNNPRMNGLGILLHQGYQTPISRPDLWTYSGINRVKKVVECPSRDVPNENNLQISYGFRFASFAIPGAIKQMPALNAVVSNPKLGQYSSRQVLFCRGVRVYARSGGQSVRPHRPDDVQH
jgi:hypothetical protein